MFTIETKMAKHQSSQKVQPAPIKSEPNGPTESSKKLDAINLAMEQIEKQYGRGSIMRFGEGGQKFDVSVVSTGSLPLDLALGVG